MLLFDKRGVGLYHLSEDFGSSLPVKNANGKPIIQININIALMVFQKTKGNFGV
jgi:hypothetical protein